MKSIKFCVAIALAMLVFTSCKDKNAQKDTQERIEKVRVQKLEMSQFERNVEYSVYLEGYETVNVAPSLTGRIEKIYVEEGSKVTKGQELLTMDQLQYKTTKLQFANLGVELERVRALLKTGSATQQNFDQLELSYNQMKENLDFYEKNTYVKAPFDGVISAKNYEEGELFSGQPILVLTQIAVLKAHVAVPERYYPIVKEGTTVSIKSEIYPDKSYKGVIERVFPTIDPSSHTFTIKVKINNPDRTLRPGMYATASLCLGNAEAFVVPFQSVLKLQGANDRYVFVNDNGVAKYVGVTLGQRWNDKVEIISDEIKEGDELIVVGQGRLVEGSKLEVVTEND